MRMEDDSEDEDEDEDESEDEDVDEDETRRGSPVDRRPSSDEVPTIGKFHTFSQIAVTFGSIMQFKKPSGLRISYSCAKEKRQMAKAVQHSQFMTG